MLITDGGIIIRTRVSEIPVYGRSASGVRVMRLGEGSIVAKFAVVDPDAESEDKNESEEIIENAEGAENVAQAETTDTEPNGGEE